MKICNQTKHSCGEKKNTVNDLSTSEFFSGLVVVVNDNISVHILSVFNTKDLNITSKT